MRNDLRKRQYFPITKGKQAAMGPVCARGIPNMEVSVLVSYSLRCEMLIRLTGTKFGMAPLEVCTDLQETHGAKSKLDTEEQNTQTRKPRLMVL